jgi:peptide/nickel transport system permease protein
MREGAGASPRLGRLRAFWRVFRRQRQAVVALVLLLATAAGVPAAVRALAIDPSALSADALAPPSLAHPMGTDYLGRDVLGRLLHGVDTSLAVGVTVAAIATSIGIALGLLAGFYGGWVDHVIMRLADGLLIVPTFFLVLLVAFIFGGGLGRVVILLSVTAWPQVSRIVRAEVLTLREEAFVASARAIGTPDPRLIFRELLPNTFPPVIAMIALLASYAILTEASLSFLGVGDPNVVSLGQMLTNGLESATTAWWVPTFPGAAIFALVLMLNALGDGLNIALNPRLNLSGVVV